MQTIKEFWWAFGIGSITLLLLGVAYIWTIVANQRHSIATREQQLKDIQEREEKLKASQRQLRNLTARLQSVREEERLILSREVHDELGQVLTVVKIHLRELTDSLKSGSRNGRSQMLNRLLSLTNLIDGSISMVKEISSDLRPIVLDNLGLKEAFEWESHKVGERGKIQSFIDFSADGISFDRDQQIGIFRIYQEALTNVLRHSNATKIQTTVLFEDKSFRMDIQDNGKGISDADIGNPKSLGLVGMRERALLLRGDLNVCRPDGGGTLVTLVIPDVHLNVQADNNKGLEGTRHD